MGETPQTRPRERLSRYLRQQYFGPRHVMRMAHDVGCSRKTAENVLDGAHWPGDLTFAAIVRRFGKDVLAAVFEPEIEPVLARLREEERQLDRELQAARARRLEAEGSNVSPPNRVDTSEAQNEPIE